MTAREDTGALRRTPLYDVHVRLGGRIVEFGGYALPVQYTSIRDEHSAVRATAGLFDVSHMGQIAFEGPSAIAALERLFTRPVRPLAPGRIRYGLLCNERGGVIDDATCYRTAEDAAFLCVNAANVAKVFDWVRSESPPDAGARDDSDATGMLALQGPISAEVLARVAGEEATQLRRFRFARVDVAGCSALVSRTGYTGSDGFEIYTNSRDTVTVFEALLAAGAPLGLVPAGLGARDTLRLEAALPLYGHELDDETTPLEAGLDRFVDLDGHAFVGADALRRQRDRGVTKRLVGFVLEGRGIARAGHLVCHEGRTVGSVTSGGPSPSLGKSIGLAYVPPALAPTGTTFDVVVRERRIGARVVELPFV